MARSSPSLSPQDLIARLKDGRPDPVYLLYGEEDLLLEETLTAILDAALTPEERSFNLDILHASETSPDRILALASSYPMMSERRVVVLREMERLAGRDKLLPYVRIPFASTVFVLIAVKPDFRTAFFKELGTLAVLCEAKPLYENRVPQWIVGKARQMGKNIAPEAAALLQQYVGRSLREIQNELEKLFIYVGGAGEISAEDVRRLVGLTRQYTIFELQKAIGRRRLPQAVEILESMLRNGESGTSLVVMLTKFFQKVWLLHDPAVRSLGETQLAGALGSYPSYLPDFREAAANFTPIALEHCFAALARTDEILKTSGMEEKTAMTMLLFALCGKKEAVPET